MNKYLSDVRNRYEENGHSLSSRHVFSIAVSTSITFGAVIGFATNNLAAGVAIGIVVGAIVAGMIVKYAFGDDRENS